VASAARIQWFADSLKHENIAKHFEQLYGKDFVEEYKKLDAAKLDTENQSLFKQFADKYLTELKAERLEILLHRLSLHPGKGPELIMRRLLDDSIMGIKLEVRGKACMALAGMLKQRAEGLPESDAKEAEKLNKESETLFERVLEKYPDVKGSGGTLAEDAKLPHFAGFGW